MWTHIICIYAYVYITAKEKTGKVQRQKPHLSRVAFEESGTGVGLPHEDNVLSEASPCDAGQGNHSPEDQCRGAPAPTPSRVLISEQVHKKRFVTLLLFPMWVCFKIWSWGWLSRWSIWLLVLAQVMMSQIVSLSPELSSVLTAWSLLGILSLPLSLCPFPARSLSLSWNESIKLKKS